MQNEYPMIAKIEVQLTQEKEMDQLPNQPSKSSIILILILQCQQHTFVRTLFLSSIDRA